MPLTFQQQPSHGLQIAVWHITETEEQLLSLLPGLLKPEHDLLQHLTFKPRRLEWLASRLLLSRLTGLYPAVEYNSCGQPTLETTNLKISISHTRNYAAVAVSKEAIPGIDIEYPSARIAKVAPRFMNPAEIKFLSPSAQTEQMAILWCAKEALFKMAGHPGLNFKTDIIVHPFNPDTKGLLSATLNTSGSQQPIKLEYQVTNDYYLVYTLNG